MDVKTAFLNSYLEEEIYMLQPEGSVVSGQENKVCKLKKSLYGLKQTPKQWHEKFDSVLMRDGFSSVEVDKCVYTKLINNECVIISLYVDDMLIFGTCLNIVLSTKQFLVFNFDMKNLGEANVILGIKIIRNDSGIMLSQNHYLERLLKKFNNYDRTPICTPYDAHTQLKKNRGDHSLMALL